MNKNAFNAFNKILIKIEAFGTILIMNRYNVLYFNLPGGDFKTILHEHKQLHTSYNGVIKKVLLKKTYRQNNLFGSKFEHGLC